MYWVDVAFQFLDAAERISTIVYRLQQQFDETANAGDGNWSDVFADAVLLLTALNVLSMDGIIGYTIGQVIDVVATPNVASNNQVVAFTRTTDGGGNEAGFVVPAWDDIVFDQDDNNLLSAAYNTAAGAVAALTVNPENNEDMGTVDWSQSRTRKGRTTIS